MNTNRLTVALALIAASCSMVFADQGPGWHRTSDDNQQVFQEIQSSTTKNPKSKSSNRAVVSQANNTVAQSPILSTAPVAQEIRDLANALGNDPLAMFNWVRNHVDYAHYRGAKKGSLTTLVELSGNDCDQSLLLRDLLTAAGIPTQLNWGVTFIPYQTGDAADLRHWLGLPQAENSNLHAKEFIYGRGTPLADVTWYTNGVDLKRVWVEATIDGETAPIKMDPSFKKYDQVIGMNIAQACGYTRSGTQDALGGEYWAPSGWLENSWKGASESNLANYLNSRATQLVQNLKLPENAGKAPIDVTGGWRMRDWSATDLDDTFPLGDIYDYTVAERWSTPPESMQSMITIRLGENLEDEYNHLLKKSIPMYELAGRRLTLEFAEGNKKAQLWLDDTLWGEEAVLGLSEFKVEIQITHPSALNLNQTFKQTYRRFAANGPGGTAIYALAYGFDVSRESLRRRERMLESYKSAGKTERSREVVGETLNIIGQQWYLQTHAVEKILASLTGCSPMSHHRIGRVAQEEGVYIDIAGQFSGLDSRTSDYVASKAAFTSMGLFASAMEHGVLSQLQDRSAASTVALISRASQSTNWLEDLIFVFQNIGAFESAEYNLDYTPAQKDEIRSYLNSGCTIVCPVSGDLRLNPSDAWHGAGFVASSSTKIAMIISGGYFGGFSTNSSQTSSTPIQTQTSTAPSYITPSPPSQPRPVSYDPVDLQTGNFLLSPPPDLSIGSTLSFVRSYDGARRTQNSAGIGFGWSHSGQLLLSERTSVESALGERGPSDMAAILVSAVTVIDQIFGGTPPHYAEFPQRHWLSGILAANWAVNLLKNNSVTVQLPDKTLEFIRQPDGTFTPPPGIPVALAKNITANTYSVTPRNGSTTTFEAFLPASAGQYRIKKTTDLWGRSQSYTYESASGRLIQITDPFGRYLTLSYEANRLKTLSDSTGRSVSYGYDGAGNLVEFKDPENSSDTYVYDSAHRMTEHRDPTGRLIIKNQYDGNGRVCRQDNQGLSDRAYYYHYAPGVTREEDPAGASTWHLFDDKNRNVGSINALGQRTKIAYDAKDRKVSEASPMGRTSSYTYDVNDNLKTSIDPTGAVTAYGYDSNNRLISVTDPLTRSTTMTYNAKHQVETVTNALNETTTHAYNPTTGYLTSTTDTLGAVTSYQYDGFGQLTRTTMPDLTFIDQSPNARGDVSWIIDARGIRTDFTYNGRRERLSATQGGRIVSTAYNVNRMPWRTTNARNFSTFSTFSPSDKLLTVTGQDGAKITTAYNTRDLPESSTGPLGETTLTSYDPVGRPHISKNPLDQTVTQSYDDDGMPTITQIPLGRTSSVGYQIGVGLPRITTVTSPLNHATLTEVDAAGQNRFITNRRGHLFEQRYDDLGRLTKIIQPGGRNVSYAYSKNATGRNTVVTEPSSQSTTLQYNKIGLLITRSGPDATTSYTYNENGSLRTTTEGSAVLTRTYEATRDLVSSYTNAAGDQISYGYDPNGNLTTLTYPGGRTVTYGYDSNDRLVAVTDWAGRVTRFGYNLSGQQISIQRPNGTRRRMVYDAAGQLSHFTEVAKNGALIASQSWNYDMGGRATQRLRNPSATPFSVPTHVATYYADNRINTLTPSGASATSVVSDLDGNITTSLLWEPTRSWQTANLNWDARNRLTGITTGNRNATYQYDAEGNLISRLNTRYTVNPNAKLSQQLIEHRPDGTKTFYIYGGGLLYEETFNAANVSQGTRTYHYDQIGSTIALTNDSGIVTGRLEYSAYGLTSFTSGLIDTKFRYNGMFGVQTDPETGLLQMRARWYSPCLGRFISEDPAGFSGGINWYAYADGNPISLSDPFGLCAGSASAFFDDGVINAVVGIVQSPFWLADQAHHILNGNWSSLGSGSYNAEITEPLDSLKNPYGKQGYYDTTGVAPTVRDSVVGAAMIAYGMKPGAAPPATGGLAAERQVLYHYTNEAGHGGITGSNSLNPSLKALSPKDVRYGNGQYLSDIAPGTKTPAQLSRDFLNQPFQGQKYTHYIEIDVTGLGATQGRSGVWVVPNETPLDLTGRILSSGKH